MPTPEDIAYVRAELDAIHEAAGGEPLDEETQARWDEGVEYVRQAAAEIERAERRNAERSEIARLAGLAGPAGRVNGDGANPGAGFNVNTVTSERADDLSVLDRHAPNYGDEVVARCRSIIADGNGWISDDHREAATRKIETLGNQNRAAEQVLLAASDTYRSAFIKTARSTEAPGSAELTAEERYRMAEVDAIVKGSGFFTPVNAEEARALALTNVTGKLVPSQLDTTVILTNDGAVNPFRQISRVVPVSTNVWTGITSAGITAGWTGAEGSEVDDDSPAFVNPSVTCYMADAFVPISFQAYEDWGGAESELERMLMDAKDRLEATAFAVGTGSNQPTGVVTALDASTQNELSMATNSTYALTDLYSLKQALPDRWKPRASFVSAEEYIDRTRQFGTSNNYHGFTVDLTAGDVAQVLGKRWYQSSAMSGTLSTATNNAIVFGDFSQYLIADRIGMVVEFVPNLFHTGNNRPSGTRGWLAHWRTGADVITPDGTAFRLLQNPAV